MRQAMGDADCKVLRSRSKNASRNEAGHYFGVMPYLCLQKTENEEETAIVTKPDNR
jgi:hypothetical protein